MSTPSLTPSNSQERLRQVVNVSPIDIEYFPIEKTEPPSPIDTTPASYPMPVRTAPNPRRPNHEKKLSQ